MAALEAGLRKLILSIHPSCPSLLRDMYLLLEPHLSNQTKLLKIVMGSPLSLNLRNITWHGLSYLLLCIINDIGHCLSCNALLRNKVTRSSECGENDVTVKFPEVILAEKYLLEMDQLQKISFSVTEILPSHAIMWRLSVKLLQEKKCLFAVVNDTPQRLMTAENTALYTTFDEILDQYLPDKSQNKLPIFLGTSLTTCLIDMLVYQGGPRIRDRLGHGEIKLEDVSENISMSILTLACCVVEEMARKMTTTMMGTEMKKKNNAIPELSSDARSRHPTTTTSTFTATDTKNNLATKFSTTISTVAMTTTATNVTTTAFTVTTPATDATTVATSTCNNIGDMHGTTVVKSFNDGDNITLTTVVSNIYTRANSIINNKSNTTNDTANIITIDLNVTTATGNVSNDSDASSVTSKYHSSSCSVYKYSTLTECQRILEGLNVSTLYKWSEVVIILGFNH
ncbi:hypothetical protein HELRODRAFT_167577 [Helobdella robusta]|uniref:DUF4209 domain-containing protein n=1 Tax=Helobdella robusta TaxID=6412 RepID=T1EZI5_HELRO|nr:hypothetical protein HELRODRAFT_167577 [Helobdella robusta]ESO11055.1 hypothetical protein HELRODRAFT_167577 [Helobdella robusta]